MGCVHDAAAAAHIPTCVHTPITHPRQTLVYVLAHPLPVSHQGTLAAPHAFSHTWLCACSRSHWHIHPGRSDFHTQHPLVLPHSLSFAHLSPAHVSILTPQSHTHSSTLALAATLSESRAVNWGIWRLASERSGEGSNPHLIRATLGGHCDECFLHSLSGIAQNKLECGYCRSHVQIRKLNLGGAEQPAHSPESRSNGDWDSCSAYRLSPSA